MKTNVVNNFTFGILLWLFNLQIILSTPVQHPVSRMILDEMMKDEQLCSLSNFLYKSDFVRECSNVTYPNDVIKLTTNTVDTFLCLAVYDAAYQICQYSSSLKEPLELEHIAEDFNFSVNKQLSQNDDYCDKLQDLEVKYNKTRLYVSQLAKELQNPKLCFALCFLEPINSQVKFRNLCAVMAWIIHMEKQMNLRFKSPKVITHPKIVKLEESKSNPGITNTNQSTNSIATDKQWNNTHMTNSEKSPTHQLLPTIKKTETHLSQIPTVNETTTINKPSASSIHIKENSEDAKKIPTNEEVLAAPVVSEVQHNSPIDTIKSNAKGKSTENVNKGSSVEEVTTSTISENTGDREDPIVNQGELAEDGLNHYEFLADPDDTNDQVLDIGNRNQNGNLLESSKQRDPVLPLYHNTRPKDDSHFFTYISVISLLCILGFVGFHNKQKILAIMLEGRRSRNNRGRRRPSTANYRKLDCTLEEAMTSQCNANVTHVIY